MSNSSAKYLLVFTSSIIPLSILFSLMASYNFLKFELLESITFFVMVSLMVYPSFFVYQFLKSKKYFRLYGFITFFGCALACISLHFLWVTPLKKVIETDKMLILYQENYKLAEKYSQELDEFVVKIDLFISESLKQYQVDENIYDLKDLSHRLLLLSKFLKNNKKDYQKKKMSLLNALKKEVLKRENREKVQQKLKEIIAFDKHWKKQLKTHSKLNPEKGLNLSFADKTKYLSDDIRAFILNVPLPNLIVGFQKMEIQLNLFIIFLYLFIFTPSLLLALFKPISE